MEESQAMGQGQVRERTYVQRRELSHMHLPAVAFSQEMWNLTSYIVWNVHDLSISLESVSLAFSEYHPADAGMLGEEVFFFAFATWIAYQTLIFTKHVIAVMAKSTFVDPKYHLNSEQQRVHLALWIQTMPSFGAFKAAEHRN